jgi:phosphate/phosphite/phosphonate ABC transporters, periplasmic binding protein
MIFLILLFAAFIVWSKEINVGFTAVITREDLKTIREFLNYLSNRTGFNFNPVFAKSYDEMDFFLFSGKVDMAYICGAPFVEGHKRFGYSIVAVPTTSEGPHYYSYVITKKDKPYKSILDFKGKPFAFSDPKSNSGSVAPSYFLLKLGHNPSEFFKPLIYTYSHYESILAVYKGFVEGASVDSIVYEHTSRVAPHLVSSLKVIQRFGPFPSTPIVASNKLDKSTVEAIRKALLEMHRNEEGRKILKSMGISGFTYISPAHYRVISSMIDYIAKSNR